MWMKCRLCGHTTPTTKPYVGGRCVCGDIHINLIKEMLVDGRGAPDYSLCRKQHIGTMRLGHISDLHLLPGSLSLPIKDYFNKRLTGYINLRLNRGPEAYSGQVLGKAVSNLLGAKTNNPFSSVDHVVVTGDLTNVALPDEFVIAKNALRPLEVHKSNFLTVLPGNHDTYVGNSLATFWRYFGSTYKGCYYWDAETSRVSVLNDPSEVLGGMKKTKDTAEVSSAIANAFPFFRVLPDTESLLIIFNSSIPRPPFISKGKIGETQWRNAERIMEAIHRQQAKEDHLYPQRLIAMHHPPHGRRSTRQAEWMHGLESDDYARLWDFCKTHEIDAIMHGHTHVPFQGPLARPGARAYNVLAEASKRTAADRYSSRTVVMEAGSSTYTKKKPFARYNVYSWNEPESEDHSATFTPRNVDMDVISANVFSGMEDITEPKATSIAVETAEWEPSTSSFVDVSVNVAETQTAEQ